MGNEKWNADITKKKKTSTQVFMTYEVLILFSRLEKTNKNNKHITKRVKELKKLIIRREEIMKVNVLAGINCW